MPIQWWPPPCPAFLGFLIGSSLIHPKAVGNSGVGGSRVSRIEAISRRIRYHPKISPHATAQSRSISALAAKFTAKLKSNVSVHARPLPPSAATSFAAPAISFALPAPTSGTCFNNITATTAANARNKKCPNLPSRYPIHKAASI